MRTKRNAQSDTNSNQKEQPHGLSASRILLYLLVILVIGVLILNFLPTIGVSGCVGVIPITGEIATTSGYGAVSSDDIVNLILQAQQRSDVRSIVVVIDSPGGSPVAANQIYTTLMNTSKPKIAYISDEGASGGYYVALGADKIFADPDSITGSIGVTSSTFFDVSGLLSNYDVNTTTVTSGAMKDIGSPYHPMTMNETQLLQGMINQMAAGFRNITDKSREGKNNRYSIASLNEVSDARVLTGQQAYDLGLVDELGTKQDAINYAAEAAGMGSNPSICTLAVQPNLLASLFTAMGRGIGESITQVSLNNQQQVKIA